MLASEAVPSGVAGQHWLLGCLRAPHQGTERSLKITLQNPSSKSEDPLPEHSGVGNSHLGRQSRLERCLFGNLMCLLIPDLQNLAAVEFMMPQPAFKEFPLKQAGWSRGSGEPWKGACPTVLPSLCVCVCVCVVVCGRSVQTQKLSKSEAFSSGIAV